MFDFFKKMNFPSLDQSNCLLGHPAILSYLPGFTTASCITSGVCSGATGAPRISRVAHCEGRGLGGVISLWRILSNDSTFQGQAVVCIIAIIVLLTSSYSSSSLRGIRYTVLSWFGWFTSVGWTASQALRLQAEQAQEALAQRLGSSMVVEHSVGSSWHW